MQSPGLIIHSGKVSFYRPQRSLGQGNIFRSVCQEFCPQGGCAWGGVWVCVWESFFLPPTMKFGARLYFQKRVSRILSTVGVCMGVCVWVCVGKFLFTTHNEVWGKVIFSEACVKNSVHRGVCMGGCVGVCVRGCMVGGCVAGGHAWQGRGAWQGGMHGGRHVWQGAWWGACMARGACVAGGHVWLGVWQGGHAWQGGCACHVCPPWQILRPRHTVNERGGMHPSGMHSCFIVFEKL